METIFCNHISFIVQKYIILFKTKITCAVLDREAAVDFMPKLGQLMADQRKMSQLLVVVNCSSVRPKK